MRIPTLEQPQRYRGLYVFDFGEWAAVGYTAEEIAFLLESEAYRGGKAYRIQRAQPDGTMELSGVSAERFKLESGMLFYRAEMEPAGEDFASLGLASDHTPPPCRISVQLADFGADSAPWRYVTILIYPAEYEQDVASWLAQMDYAGGDLVEGGISHVTNYHQQDKTVLDRRQLWGASTTAARSPEQVLASVRRAVQR